MIKYQPYQKKEGGEFIKLKEEIPNVGDKIKLECIDGAIKDGKFGPQLIVNVKHKEEERALLSDAPHEGNEMSGSQIYRGFMDNNIQPGDTFYIENGGRMDNQYKTIIYNVSVQVIAKNPNEVSDDEDVNIENLPFWWTFNQNWKSTANRRKPARAVLVWT